MFREHGRSSIRMRALVCLLLVGCAAEPAGDDVIEPPAETATCDDPAAYTPYSTTAHPIGPARELPWHGAHTTYPASLEDFRAYGEATVECSRDKSAVSHLDVTAGCLTAVANTRGRITSTSDGAFRSIVLGYTDDASHPIRWTDQTIEYAFFYAATSGPGVLPGFKAFARYNTEDDLYVASWRTDGVVQIQRKQCGVYTPLKIIEDFGAPAPNTWHRIRFSAIGDVLELSLDGARVITVTDPAFASGTLGIRTDAMTGALIDDWSVN